MANGRYREKVLAKLRVASRKTTLDLDATAFAKALRGESDRGTIILGATMIDDRLAYQLEKRANALDGQAPELRKRVRQSFAGRLETARKLGLIAPLTADMIDVIREMRNACAHSRDKLTFRSPAIADALDLLLAPDSASLKECTPAVRRDVFVVVCGCLAATVSGGLSGASLAAIEPILVSVAGSVPSWIKGR